MQKHTRIRISEHLAVVSITFAMFFWLLFSHLVNQPLVQDLSPGLTLFCVFFSFAMALTGWLLHRRGMLAGIALVISLLTLALFAWAIVSLRPAPLTG